MKISHDHPATTEFALQAGRLIQNFGVVELTSYRWIDFLSSSPIATEISKELPLSKRVEIILRLIPHCKTMEASSLARAANLWKKIKDEGLERRNTVAHGTVSLALTADDSSLAPETIGILKHRKWQDSDQLMGLDELKNAVNVTAAIANELNALLPPSDA